MSTIIVSLFVFLLLTAGAMGLVLVVYKKSHSAPHNPTVSQTTVSEISSYNGPVPSFRFVDILLPVVIFILAVVSAIYLFRLLPSQVAYHFDANGSGDRWLGRGLLMIEMLLPQLLLTALSALIAIVMIKVSGGFVREGKTPASVVRGVIGLMSNIIALPQIILLFAMLDIFLYNAYQIRLFPLYIFIILVMCVGGLVMAYFFFRIIQQSRKANQG
jgi:uncharacterized membrane protein